MAWSIRCKFIRINKDTKEMSVVSEAYIDRLKCLSERSYDIAFDFYPIFDYNIPETICSEKGYVFTSSEYNEGAQKYLKEYNEHEAAKNRLLSIRESVEYYKLTDEQKESLDNDICFHEEIGENCKTKLEACQFMISLINYFNNCEIHGRYEDEVITCLTVE